MIPRPVQIRRYFTLVVALLLPLISAAQDPARQADALEPAINGLLRSTADDAYLVIAIAGTPDFVQMAAYRGVAELDFPQITDRQKALRQRVEDTCNELGLPLTIVDGSNGTEFLDYELPSDAAEIARIVRLVLKNVFDAGPDVTLEIEWNGFELPAD